MKIPITFLSIFTAIFSILNGTPTSIFWTNCTTDVVECGSAVFMEDNFSTVFNRRHHGSSFAPDTGVEFGVLSYKDLGVEAGFDYSGGDDDPLYFNIGAAIEEDKLFRQAPSFKVGFFNAGTRTSGHKATNQNIVDFIFGKTLPENIGGRLFFGVFSGSRAIGKNRQGFMVAYQRGFCPTKYCDDTEYDKWVLNMDYASGKNTIGGGGIGVAYYFTPTINLLTGPVFFNSKKINGNWKWSVQINIGFDIFTCKKSCDKKEDSNLCGGK